MSSSRKKKTDLKNKDLSLPLLLSEIEDKPILATHKYTSTTTYHDFPVVVKQIIRDYLTTPGYVIAPGHLTIPGYVDIKVSSKKPPSDSECLAQTCCLSAFDCGGHMKDAINPCPESRKMTRCIDITCLPLCIPVGVIGLALGACGLFADGAKSLKQKAEFSQYKRQYKKEKAILDSYLPPPTQRMT